MDLVSEAGVDISDWANFNGHAAANPKYCFEWAFVETGKVVVINLWPGQIERSNGREVRTYIAQDFEGSFTEPRSRLRAFRMTAAIDHAYTEGLPIRVIRCEGQVGPEGKTKVEMRSLDGTPWAVTSYDGDRDEYRIARGAQPISAVTDPERDGFPEGELRFAFVKHRHREAAFRRAKISDVLNKTGRLICEVKKCHFDFLERYGGIGEGFAHVHHLELLSWAPPEGRKASLEKLAIVCANCHAMIHAGGECRPLAGLVP